MAIDPVQGSLLSAMIRIPSRATTSLLALLLACASCSSVDPEEKLQRANEALDRGEWDAAILDYTGILGRDPGSVRAWNNRGVCRLQKSDLDGAISDFDQCLKLVPDYAEAYYNRATARLRRGDSDGAVADYGEALRLNPQYGKAFAGRGLARSRKSDLAGAASDLKQALEVSPTDWPDRLAVEAELVRVLRLRDGK